MLRFSRVAIGAGGRTLCARCSPSPRPARHRPAAEVIDEIATLARSSQGGPANLALAGSDPLGHPEVGAIVEGAVRAGADRLRVDTDGLPGGVPVVSVGDLVSLGVRHLRVRLLAGSPHAHDMLAARPGAFDAACAVLADAAAAARRLGTRVALSAELPVCVHTVQEAPVAVAAALQAGARTVVIRLDGRGDGTATPAPPDEAAPWVAAACDTAVANGGWAWVTGIPGALLPAHALHLAPGAAALAEEDVV